MPHWWTIEGRFKKRFFGIKILLDISHVFILVKQTFLFLKPKGSVVLLRRYLVKIKKMG